MAVSRMVKQRLDRHEKISAAAVTLAQRTASGAYEQLQPHLEEGKALTEDHLLTLLVALNRRSSAAADAMKAKDESHNRELGEDVVARGDLEAAADKSHGALRDFKDAARAAHGQPFLETLQIHGKTPSDPRTVSQQLGLVVAWLENPEKELPPRRTPLVEPLNKELVLGHIKSIHANLEAKLSDYKREIRESEETMLAKHSAMEMYESAEVQATSVLDGLMLLAGMEEEAKRLRPTTPSRTKPTDTTPSSGEPTPSS